MLKHLSLRLIRIGRWIAKKLRVESNPVVLAVHRWVLQVALRGTGARAEVRIFDHRFVLARDLSLLPGLWNGTFEQFEIQFVETHLKEGQVFFDLGANFGLYTVLTAKLVGPKGLVVAFEPSPTNFEFLQSNTGHFNNVVLVSAAVGRKSGGEIGLVSDPNNPGGTSVTKDATRSKASAPLVGLDDFLREKQLPKPDMIKIDVEGFEAEVLEGLQVGLKESTIILCEFNPQALWAQSIEPNSFLNRVHERFYSVEFFDDLDGELKPIFSQDDLHGQQLANLVLRRPRWS